MKNQFLGPSWGREAKPFRPSFPFFPFFSHVFFCLFLAFYFFIFLVFCSFLHFLFFFCFSFFQFFLRKVSSFLLPVFLSNIFNCWRWYQSLIVSSVVGAPWRCGGIAGIGLGRLLG